MSDFLLTVCLALFTEDSRKYYKEGQLVTIYSAIKLLITSSICWKIFKLRLGIISSKVLNNMNSIWLLISIGFFFLAIDELALIHENIDKLIHIIFNMEESPLSDRLDDLIVFIYALIGCAVLYRYKEEIIKYKFVLKYIMIGLALLFVMVIADVLTNKTDILEYFITNKTDMKAVKDILDYIEEITKLISESVFIVAFYGVIKHLQMTNRKKSL
ncbi:MAG: hypothetical protein GTO02_08525 [Candidatus Dadabacteria bacterium]|nr:hypothetical protein [Candidatus Dadabacteria bacterium]NIQ14432.1 hypothetical protein [Candidatus Dadabacteria bacterium]